MKYISFGLLVFIFLVALYFLPLKVKVKSRKEGGTISLEIEINIFFVKLLRFNLHSFEGSKSSVLKVLGINLNIEKRGKDLYKKSGESLGISAKNMDFFEILRIFKDMLKGTVVYRFYLAIKVGLEDAAYTAILTGSLWGMVYTAIMPFYNNAKFLNPPEVHIMPIYGENRVEGDLICIFKTRCGNIIINGMKLWNNLKGR